MPGGRSRLWRHLYALALAALIGGSSAGVLVGTYWALSGRLGSVAAMVVAIAVSIVVLFAMMLFAYELTEKLVKRNIM